MKYRIVKRLNPQNNEESKFYAAPQYMEELAVKDLAKDISDACTLNVTDVEAVLTSLVRKLPMYLKNGFKIRLGNFGRVKLSFSSKGFEKQRMLIPWALQARGFCLRQVRNLKTKSSQSRFPKCSAVI